MLFQLDGLGTLFITQINGVGGAEGPKFLDAYTIESLLAFAAFFVLATSFCAELAVGWLDPRGIVAASTAATFSVPLAAAGIGGADKLLPATFLVIVATVTVYDLTAAPLACSS